MLGLDLGDLDLLDADHIGGPAEDAIAAGTRDEGALTDLEFFARHPERDGKKIGPEEKALAKEWTSIRDDVVRPALARAGTPAPTPSSGPTSSPPGEKKDPTWMIAGALTLSVLGIAVAATR